MNRSTMRLPQRKIVFFGTPDIAASILESLLQDGREISMVLSQPDRPAGRGQKMHPSPVKALAKQYDLLCLCPEKIIQQEMEPILSQYKDHIFVVVAYGKILRPWLIDLPHRIINVHASLLPRWRGAAPIHRSIMAGDTLSGVTIMKKIVPELDAGDMLLQKNSIDIDVNTGELLTAMTTRKLKPCRKPYVSLIKILTTIKRKIYHKLRMQKRSRLKRQNFMEQNVLKFTNPHPWPLSFSRCIHICRSNTNQTLSKPPWIN
ncbi:MAG: methionyl-tRNA formyltransferase [Bdellovibrionota bacterium]